MTALVKATCEVLARHWLDQAQLLCVADRSLNALCAVLVGKQIAQAD